MFGRPKRCRRKDQNEESKRTKVTRMGKQMRCSNCKIVGHNRTKCPSLVNVNVESSEAGAPMNAEPIASHSPPRQPRVRKARLRQPVASHSPLRQQPVASHSPQPNIKREKPPKGWVGVFTCRNTRDNFIKLSGQKRGIWAPNYVCGVPDATPRSSTAGSSSAPPPSWASSSGAVQYGTHESNCPLNSTDVATPIVTTSKAPPALAPHTRSMKTLGVKTREGKTKDGGQRKPWK